MKVKHAQQVVDTIANSGLGPGTLWISGLLDESSEAVRTLKRHAARKRRATARKLAEKSATPRSTKEK